jgi:DinB superfamily
MPAEVAIRFRNNLDDVRRALLAVSSDLADVPWRPDGWTRKQIVGHLLDSAANNRQRFVRAAIDGVYTGPGYAQDAWVALHGYSSQSWDTLLRWWQAEHEMLAAIVDRIPADRMRSPCKIGEGDPVPLQFLIEDYVAHQRHHLGQITASRS